MESGSTMRLLQPNWDRSVSVGGRQGSGEFHPATIAKTRPGAAGISIWLQGCKDMKERRIREILAWEREQHCVAMGNWAHLNLKRWRSVAKALKTWRNVSRRYLVRKGWRRLAYRPRLVDRLLFSRWKRYAKLKRLLARLELRRAFQKWSAVLDQIRLFAAAFAVVVRKPVNRSWLRQAFEKWARHSFFHTFLNWIFTKLTRCYLADAWKKLLAPRNSGPPKKRLGQCACVYGRKCSREEHTKWRIVALREKVNTYLLDQSPGYYDFAKGQRPPSARRRDKQDEWDKARVANAIASRAHQARKTPSTIETPTVEKMSVEALRQFRSKNATSVRGGYKYRW